MIATWDSLTRPWALLSRSHGPNSDPQYMGPTIYELVCGMLCDTYMGMTLVSLRLPFHSSSGRRTHRRQDLATSPWPGSKLQTLLKGVLDASLAGPHDALVTWAKIGLSLYHPSVVQTFAVAFEEV